MKRSYRKFSKYIYGPHVDKIKRRPGYHPKCEQCLLYIEELLGSGYMDLRDPLLWSTVKPATYKLYNNMDQREMDLCDGHIYIMLRANRNGVRKKGHRMYRRMLETIKESSLELV